MAAIMSEERYWERIKDAGDFYKYEDQVIWSRYKIGSFIELNDGSSNNGKKGRVAARTIGPNIVMILIDDVEEPQYASVEHLKLI